MDRPLGTARRYAAALLGTAGESQAAATLSAELDRFAAVVAAPGARLLLDDPRGTASSRLAALEQAAGGAAPKAVRSLLEALGRRRRLGDLPAIAEAVREALDARNGVTHARVTSALELGEAERSRLEAEAQRIAGGSVRMDYDIDGSLVGGVTLRVGDRLVDGSVKGRLARMRQAILSAAG